MNGEMDQTKSSKIAHLVLAAIAVHILLLIAILDIHFKSPLERGMAPVRSIEDPPAKRLVIFIADGLRAQAIFDQNENVTSYLTSIRETRGSWGVSHARVPTESRPNHVAILAGIYEDPSAIFKSWQKFPIDFDTVFNESTYSWIIGTDEITSVFNKNLQNNVKTLSSPADLLDYKKENHQVLDEWVFKQMTMLLENSEKSSSLQELGIIFSLHLSGLDMTGHSKKPYSDEYFDNIRYVDRKIRKIEYLVNQTFRDNLTAFIFTSDHGMTDWGSHGSGSDQETFTPFIAWGAGIKHDKERRDIQQIDIAPLISSLLGLNYPINSLGRVPTMFLNLPAEKKLQIFLNNLKQLYRILEVKQNRIVQNKLLFLHRKAIITPENLNETINEIYKNFNNSTPEEAFWDCKLFYDKISLEIDYFDNYYMVFLISCIGIGFFLWILYVCTYFVHDLTIPKLQSKEEKILAATFFITTVLLILLCFTQSFSFPSYLYVLFPNVMFHLLLRKRKKLFYLCKQLRKISLRLGIQISLTGIFIIVAIVSFYYRFCFSIVTMLVSCSIFVSDATYDFIDICSWLVVSLIISFFPLLPVMMTKFHVVGFVIGYIIWQYLNFCVFLRKWYKVRDMSSITNSQKVIFMLQNICLNAGFILVLSSKDESMDNYTAVRITSWFIFLTPIVLIPFSMTEKNVRLLTIFSAFIPFYLLTSMSYELIFMTFYTIQLILWMNMEKKEPLEDADIFQNLQKSLIFVASIFIGYFGPGNIASINSFDPMWVKFLVSAFCPFRITFLIFLKVTLPFLFAGCSFSKIVLTQRLNLIHCFSIVILVSDVMVFYFMFNVRNVGSWYEIGMSLSYFVVVECFTIGTLCLYFVAHVLTSVEISMQILDQFVRKFQLPY